MENSIVMWVLFVLLDGGLGIFSIFNLSDLISWFLSVWIEGDVCVSGVFFLGDGSVLLNILMLDIC